jgi:hypothetical protein
MKTLSFYIQQAIIKKTIYNLLIEINNNLEPQEQEINVLVDSFIYYRRKLGQDLYSSKFKAILDYASYIEEINKNKKEKLRKFYY